ncbi:MAG: FecR domain-containing protein [Bacteroidota bacterium]
MANRQELIKKYQAGQLNEEERAWLMNDLRQNPEHPAYKAVLHQLWEEASKARPLSPSDSQRLSQVFQERRRVYSEPPVRRMRFWRSAAAIGGLLITGAILWFWLLRDPLIEYAADYGKIHTLILPDSSVVTLNANSSIRYSSNWNNEAPREVWLDGEAYFSVTHTETDQAFIVHVTDDLRVNVLGTEFNVKDRRSEAEIVLYQGKVKLSIDHTDDTSETVEMQPGDLVEVSGNDTKNIAKKVIDIDQYQMWRERKMIFNKVPLREIAIQLEDIYGVKITIKSDSLADTYLTGAFPTENLKTVLVSLQTIIPMKVTKSGDSIILQPDN